MKKKGIISIVLVLLTTIVMAQQNKVFRPLLTPYFTLKESLVAGNAKSASEQAGAMLTALKGIDARQIAPESQKLISALQSSAQQLAQAKDIAKQRDVFATLSGYMMQLAKTEMLSDAYLYIDYCPMKKAYWLSDSKPIRNPYYGNSMLTCGEIKETIKP